MKLKSLEVRHLCLTIIYHLSGGGQLAEHLNANIELVKIGVMLMDIKGGEARSVGRLEEHVRMSAEYAEDILDKHKVDEKQKQLLLNCVLAHHGNVPYESLEAEICANADCYRFLHPKGVFTFIQTVTKRGKNQNEAIDMVLAKLEEKHNILSLDICKQELEPFYQQIKKLLLMAKI